MGVIDTHAAWRTDNLVMLSAPDSYPELRQEALTINGFIGGRPCRINTFIYIQDTHHEAEYEWRALNKDQAKALVDDLNSSYGTAGGGLGDGLILKNAKFPIVDDTQDPPLIAYQQHDLMMGRAKATYSGGAFWTVRVTINYITSKFSFNNGNFE